MKNFVVLSAAVFLLAGFAFSQDSSQSPPRAGSPQIMKASEVKPGMKGTAWTVFEGAQPEPVPIEIIGSMKNAWGPQQDIILAKMGGRALRTNVAGGMSGSPVYIDGKLIGAVALRLSVFSPDAICGITPIELMLEINDFDNSRPADARTPDKAVKAASIELPGGLSPAVASGMTLTPIETPLVLAGFHASPVRRLSESAKKALRAYLAVRGDINEALFISQRSKKRLLPREIQRIVKKYDKYQQTFGKHVDRCRTNQTRHRKIGSLAPTLPSPGSCSLLRRDRANRHKVGSKTKSPRKTDGQWHHGHTQIIVMRGGAP